MVINEYDGDNEYYGNEQGMPQVEASTFLSFNMRRKAQSRDKKFF